MDDDERKRRVRRVIVVGAFGVALGLVAGLAFTGMFVGEPDLSWRGLVNLVTPITTFGGFAAALQLGITAGVLGDRVTDAAGGAEHRRRIEGWLRVGRGDLAQGELARAHTTAPIVAERIAWNTAVTVAVVVGFAGLQVRHVLQTDWADPVDIGLVVLLVLYVAFAAWYLPREFGRRRDVTARGASLAG
jgi:hypothetical protein